MPSWTSGGQALSMSSIQAVAPVCAIDGDEALAFERNVRARLIHGGACGWWKWQRDLPGLLGGKHGRDRRLDLLRSLAAKDLVRAEAQHEKQQ